MWSDFVFDQIRDENRIGIGNGSQHMPIVDNRDVVDQTIALIEKDAADGTYIMSAGDEIQMSTILAYLARLAGKDPLYVPALVAKEYARVQEFFANARNEPSKMSIDLLKMGSVSRHLSSEKVVEATGLDFRPTAETIRDTMAYLNTSRQLGLDHIVLYEHPPVPRDIAEALGEAHTS